MKKTLTIVALMVIVTMLTISGVNAATKATLADDLYTKLSAYGATEADKVKVERYIADNNVTDEQANTILAKADEAIAVMKAEGVTDVTKLSAESKSKIQAIAQDAASVIGLKLTFSKGKVEIYNAEGKLVETVTLSNTGKLAYTGNNVNTILVVSSVAVIALAATVVAKKRLSKVGA